MNNEQFKRKHNFIPLSRATKIIIDTISTQISKLKSKTKEKKKQNKNRTTTLERLEQKSTQGFFWFYVRLS